MRWGIAAIVTALVLIDAPAKETYAAEAATATVEALQSDIAAGKLDDLIGHYRLSTYTVVSITREGKQIFAQAGDDTPFLDLIPQAKDRFSGMDGRAQVTFSRDAKGNVSALTLKQGPNETLAKRVTSEEAAAIKAELARRVSEQKPAAGTEAILRQHIDAMRAGNPIYDKMAPALATAVKAQAAASQARLAQVGAIRTIEFKGVTPNGLDTYHVIYEKGTTEYVIGFQPDGKIGSLGARFLQ